MENQEKQSFNISELQVISALCSVLRTCDGVKPFSLANRINGSGLAADAAIKSFQSDLELIKERESVSKDAVSSEQDLKELIEKKYAIALPSITESEFADLEIAGEKDLTHQDGGTKKIGYRDAYFNLLSLGVVKR